MIGHNLTTHHCHTTFVGARTEQHMPAQTRGWHGTSMRRFLLVALLFIVCEMSEARGPVQISGVPPRTPTPQGNPSCTRSACCKWPPAPAERHECTTDIAAGRGRPGAVPPTANNNALPLRALHTYHRPQGADAGGQRDTNRDSCVWGRRRLSRYGPRLLGPGPLTGVGLLGVGGL